MVQVIGLLRCLLSRPWSLTELGLELGIDLGSLKELLAGLREAGLPLETRMKKGRRYYHLDAELVGRDFGI